MNTVKIQGLTILVKFQKSRGLEHIRTFPPKVTKTKIIASNTSHYKERSTAISFGSWW